MRYVQGVGDDVVVKLRVDFLGVGREIRLNDAHCRRHCRRYACRPSNGRHECIRARGARAFGFQLPLSPTYCNLTSNLKGSV